VNLWMKHRNARDDTKTGVSTRSRDEHGGHLFTGHAVSGVEKA
jgi:hypothetical protein